MAAERTIIHIDMDAFYASVEQRDNPELRGKPVIVGGNVRRGVVCAASYEVRKFGVRSAMPMARAVRLAPQAIVVAPRFSAYVEASEAVFDIFSRITPLIEPLSLDEAFLDVTGSQRLFGDGAQIADRIRRAIKQEVNLPASAGIASVKFVAKIASDFAKPNGVKIVPAADTRAFLSPLPVSRLWGVGPKSEERLLSLGLRTLGDIASKTPEWLDRYLGHDWQHLYTLSQGIDPREVEPDREAKSIGAEDTFEDDVFDRDELLPEIHSQALRVGARLRRAGVFTKTVQLKIKLSDFTVLTRQLTLPQPTSDGQSLYHSACELLSKLDLSRGVRLTGVSAQGLVDKIDSAPQLQLFAPKVDKPLDEKRNKLNAAMDKIHDKFGANKLTTADLLNEPTAEDDEARRKVGAAKFDK